MHPASLILNVQGNDRDRGSCPPVVHRRVASRLTRPRWLPQNGHESTTWERVLFVAGLVLLGGLVVQTVLIGAVHPQLARVLAGAAVTEAIAGREGGIPVALAQGAPRILVFQYSAVQDLGTAFLVYPLFLRLIRRTRGNDNFLVGRIRRIEAVAERNEKYVRRWGPLGVFTFMLVPFLVNGPLVGLLVGRVAGIRTRHLLLPVVGATLVGAGAWTFFYDQMLGFARGFHPSLPRWVAAGTVGVIVLLGAANLVRGWRTHRRRGAPPPA
jgi:uncharacterized membrane protein